MPFSFFRRRRQQHEAEQLMTGLRDILQQVAGDEQGGEARDLNSLFKKLGDDADKRAAIAREKFERREKRYKEEALEKTRQEREREEMRRAEVQKGLWGSQRRERERVKGRGAGVDEGDAAGGQRGGVEVHGRSGLGPREAGNRVMLRAIEGDARGAQTRSSRADGQGGSRRAGTKTGVGRVGAEEEQHARQTRRVRRQ
ncbi:MAG: hypothetical protein Q9181_006596 [Wetmoreana brouardii]